MTTPLGDHESPAATPRPTPLVVRTVALDDPGDLLALLPARAPLAWVRRGDGLVGWGEAIRIDVHGERRFTDAEQAWRNLIGQAVVRDEVRLPGTGPVAFGSFAFHPISAAGCCLVVPRVVVGRRDDRAWLTVIETAGNLGPTPDAALLAGHREALTPVA